MGLLYILPISEDEVDRVRILDNGIVLKSYGLPLLFWGYLAGALAVVFAMGIAIKHPLEALYHTQDPLNQALALSCAAVLLGTPLAFLSLFFYEYQLIKRPGKITKAHTLLGLPFFKKTLLHNDQHPLEIIHFMDSPNVAKLHGDSDLRGFQNKGHFLLVSQQGDKHIIIDRSSKKADLIKLKKLLDEKNIQGE